MRNQVVVITGASSGIGRATALKLARGGGVWLVLAARRLQLLESLAQECKVMGADSLVIETDVSQPDQVLALAKQTLQHFGGLDVWINNAGVAACGPFEEIPLEQHEQVIATDLMGAIYGSHVALGHFREEGWGILINVASVLGKLSVPFMASYIAANFGIRALGLALRLELEHYGEDDIHVCTVLPASTDTPFFQHAANHTGKEVRPIPPIYDAHEVADAILGLVAVPRAEVVVGKAGRLAVLAAGLAPGLVDLLSRWATRATFKKAAQAFDSEGNLLTSSPLGSGISGGWKRG